MTKRDGHAEFAATAAFAALAGLADIAGLAVFAAREACGRAKLGPTCSITRSNRGRAGCRTGRERGSPLSLPKGSSPVTRASQAVPQRAQRIIRPLASKASGDRFAGAAQWGQAVATASVSARITHARLGRIG
jgi:hypothetical protein